MNNEAHSSFGSRILNDRRAGDVQTPLLGGRPGHKLRRCQVRVRWGHVANVEDQVALLIHLQLLTAGFGQRRNGHDHDKIGAHGENCDRMTQGHGLAEVAYERGE